MMSESESRMSELERKITDGSKCFEDYKMLAVIYNDREEYEKLLMLIEKIFNLPLKNEEKACTFTIKGLALANLGNREEVSCYEQSIRLFENEEETSRVLYHNGINHYSLLHYTDNERRNEHGRLAIEMFRKLTSGDAGYDRYKVNFYLGVLYTIFNNFSEALESFNKSIEISKNNAEKISCLTEIAITYREQGDYNRAEKTFEQILRMTDDSKYYSMLYFQMGVMYFNSNSKGKAKDAFNNALRYKEFAPILVNDKMFIAEIYWYLGTSVYGYNNDYDKAIKFFDKALECFNEEHGYYYDSHITLGHCYLAKGDYDKAKEHYNVVSSATSVTDEQKDMVNKCLNEIETKRNGPGNGSFFSKIKNKKK